MKEILCFGDSNTYGLVPKKNKRFSYNQRWTGILSELLGENFHITEEGLCGRTTVFDDFLRHGRRGTSSLPIILESHSDTNLVVLMLGTNDLKTCFRTNEKIIALGIEKLINQIQSFNKDIQILLVSPIFLGEQVWKNEFDPEFDRHSIEISKKLKSEYQIIAKKYNLDFLAASDFVSPSKIDQEHLDEENHKIFAKVVYKKIKEMNVA